ncbi:hypothetical protein AXF42_Ash012198 [Apostasia shenzhenica]|uniref:Uncharacterized protein n=1 Tax=Apostasia shenzhenica TaxID=1088818 RepID=A0A2I0B4B1_9ASPA|nr:hypothetical protein AXF42_Ash012198 [Apostasia shenzhenica]
MYSFLKLLQAERISWSLTLFRGLFSWMTVPGYGGCLALRAKTRKAMFSGASSSHSDWRDYYFFVGGDLGIPLTPGVCPPEVYVDVKWMAGQDTLRNLGRLKGRSWPLKDFLRHVRNDISLHAKTLGYNVLKEVDPPLGTVQMKRARRGHPPATQLGKEAAVGGEGVEVEIPELVCGGAIVNVVSSSDDAADDKKTLPELGYTGKGKEPMPATKPQAISKEGAGITIGGKGESNNATVGQEKVGESHSELIPKEVPGEKRGNSGNSEPEPPKKKARGKEVGGFAAREPHKWEKSVEPPFSAIFTGYFGDDGVRMAVRTTGVDRRLTVVTVPSDIKGRTYRGEVGLALEGGLVSEDMEEMESTSTPDLYSRCANRLAMVLARLTLALNRAMRTEEQALELGSQLAVKFSQLSAVEGEKAQLLEERDKLQEERAELQREKAELQKELVAYQSALGVAEANNKALQEKLIEASGKQETIILEKSLAAVEVYKTSLPCRKLRLEGIRRSWEGLVSALVQVGKITATELEEVDPFPCMAIAPTYKKEGFDLFDEVIHRVFRLLDRADRG